MTVLAFNDRHRLAIIVAAVLDALDAEFSEAELDRDDNPPRTALYNLASAVNELVDIELELATSSSLDISAAAVDARRRRQADSISHANREMTEVLMRGIGEDTNRVERLRDAILDHLREA